MSDGLVTLANDHLRVTVADMGAEMQSLETASGAALLWHGDSAWWGGRSPVLFPIVGRAPEDRIAVEGRVAPMAQHGFARRARFALRASDGESCLHELAADAATRAVYPFEFRLALRHSLAGAALTVAAEVVNDDVKPMPFGLGFHPAFLWPLPGAEGRDHAVTLGNGAEPALARLEGGLLPATRLPSPFKGGRLVLDPAQYEADAMIFPEGAGSELVYGPDAGPKLRFRFENLPNLAIWQKPGAPFICIEPWHGMAAAAGAGAEIADRPYSLTLAPGATARFAFTVELV